MKRHFSKNSFHYYIYICMEHNASERVRFLFQKKLHTIIRKQNYAEGVNNNEQKQKTIKTAL